MVNTCRLDCTVCCMNSRLTSLYTWLRKQAWKAVECLQLGAGDGHHQTVVYTGTGGTVCIRVLVSFVLGCQLHSVLSQVLAAGAEGVVERGGEAGNICGDVGKNLWRRLVVVTDLKKKNQTIKVC